MENSRPIGVFDSGVGGLTVVKHIIENLPGESIIYVGDTANVPYGGKSTRELVRLGKNIIDFLIHRGVKAVVAACNTSSSISLPILRGFYDIPLLDVILPGARNAVSVTRNGKIGVIATQATVNSQAYTGHIQALEPGLEVYEVACPRFVPLVESGQFEGEEVEKTARLYLEPLIEYGIDTLVLGCTHYPFLAPVIRRVMGQGVSIVDPAFETVKYLQAALSAARLANQSGDKPSFMFYATGPTDSFFRAGKIISTLPISEVKSIEVG